MKNKMLFIFAMILLMAIPMVYADTYKQGKELDFKTSCVNNGAYCSTSSYCNITVMYPNSTVMIDNQQMTNAYSYHNYTITAEHLSVLGIYPVKIVCVDAGEYGFEDSNFEITATGSENPTGEKYTTIMVWYIIAIAFFVVIAFFFKKYPIILYSSVFLALICMISSAGILLQITNAAGFENIGIIVNANYSLFVWILRIAVAVFFIMLLVSSLYNLLGAGKRTHEKASHEEE